MIPADDYRGMTVEIVDGRAVMRRVTREAAARAFAVALRGCFAPDPFRAGLTAGVKGTLD